MRNAVGVIVIATVVVVVGAGVAISLIDSEEFSNVRRRQLLLVRAELVGEEGAAAETARIDDGEATGDERDRDRNGADPRSS